MYLDFTLEIMFQSGHNFAHVTTAKLSWHVQYLLPYWVIRIMIIAMIIFARFGVWAHNHFVKQVFGVRTSGWGSIHVEPAFWPTHQLSCCRLFHSLLAQHYSKWLFPLCQGLLVAFGKLVGPPTCQVNPKCIANYSEYTVTLVISHLY